MYSYLWIPILLGLSVAVTESHDEQTLCAYSKANLIKQYNHTSGNFVDANNTEHCSKPTDSCFILWQEDPKNKSIIILTQGCWDSTDANCKQSECIAYKKASKARNHTKFCCCSGNFCNINVTDGYLKDSSESVEDPALEFVDHMSYTVQIVIVIVVVIVFVFVVTITSFLTRMYCSSPKRSNESLHLMEAPPPLSPNFDLDTLKIFEKTMGGQGSFGSVYRGSLNEHSVAVKIFPYMNHEYFINERDIYTLPHMDHLSLPKYIGSKERPGDDGRPEYLLVVSYCPLGCLQDYLRDRAIDWNSLCKMTLSITRGLAHLHTEIDKGGKFKHCIAHRDLTSRNILVKPDGTCMLCDFGFAVRVSGSKYYVNGVEHLAETFPLTEVGTYRYMAPELLDGAVNLRDLETSLKQIDVYALGLVLWEISSRCVDLYQGMEVPPYKLPFASGTEAGVGPHTTMEQMQHYVVKEKIRPPIPDIWKDTNPAIRSLKETIEDCWDQDAEARLTALCVEQRLADLPVMWERYKAGLEGSGGISPTLNSTGNLQKSSSMLKKSSNDSNLALDCIDDNDQLICPPERVNSLSDCTTETLLSPSDATTQQINSKNSMTSNISPATKVGVPLQAYQGRNPCLARNLMPEQPDDLPVIGNSILDCPSKYTDKKIYSFSDGDSNIFSLPNGVESNLVSSDLINHSRVCNPIPYIQNEVNAANTIPKKCNTLANNSSKDLTKEGRRWGPFFIFDRRKIPRGSIRAGLKVLLDRKTSISNGHLPEEQQPLKSSGISSPVSPSETGGKQGQTNPVNSFWSCNDVKENEHLVTTEVKLGTSNDANPIVRPLNNPIVKPAGDKNVLKTRDTYLSSRQEIMPERVENNCSPFRPITDDDDELKTSEKTKRPTTLPVQSLKNGLDNEDDCLEMSDTDISKELANDGVIEPENINNNSTVVRRRGSGNKRKGVKRVQTPFEITGRFSLIDDRIMSSQELPTVNTSLSAHSHLDNAKFASVPLNMNTLCSTTQASNTVPPDQHEEAELKEMHKGRPLNGLIVPVSHNGHQNVFIV